MNDLCDKLKFAIHNVVVRFLSRLTMKNTGRCLIINKINRNERRKIN